MTSSPSMRWLVVSGSRERVENYLYSHTTVLADANDGFGDVCLAITLSLTDNAQFLADYQAGRLQSGAMRCEVLDSLDQAVERWRSVLEPV